MRSMQGKCWVQRVILHKYIYMKMKSLNDFFSNDFTKITKKKTTKIKRLVSFIATMFAYDFNSFTRLLLRQKFCKVN